MKPIRPEVAASANPIGDAIAKYAQEIALPPLTPEAPDDLIIAHLARGSNAVMEAEETRARQAYNHAASRHGAPLAALNLHLSGVVQKLRTLKQQNQAAGTRNAADWACQMAALRVCLDAGSYFAAFSNRWGLMSEDQRRQEREQTDRDATARAYTTGSAAMAPAAFSPATFLTTLAARGITVAPGTGDALLVTAAKGLTPAERGILAAQKPAILAAFGVETF